MKIYLVFTIACYGTEIVTQFVYTVFFQIGEPLTLLLFCLPNYVIELLWINLNWSEHFLKYCMILCVISALQTHIFLNILNHANVSWSLSVLKCINKATVKRKKSWTAWDLNTIPRTTFGAFSNKNPAEAAARQFPANQIQGRGVWQKRVLGLGFHLSEVLVLWEFT